jgi:putative tricarboxylic transport membrane protein
VRVNDSVIGAVLLVLSLAVLWHVQDFPDIPGQPYGAALYPTVVSLGLLMFQGIRDGGPLFAFQASSSKGVAAFAITLGSLIFYVFAVDHLGFVVCSTLMLIAVMWAYGVRPLLLVPVAVVATLVIHTGFYRLLKVPLPWGLLQPIAW